jgi:hypothetical protein
MVAVSTQSSDTTAQSISEPRAAKARRLAVGSEARRLLEPTVRKLAKLRVRRSARRLQLHPRMKPILLTDFQDGTITESEPIVMTWSEAA